MKLVKNLKLKRLMAILLLFVTVLSCLTVKTPEVVKAEGNSNDRRREYIKLIGGSKLTDLEDISSFTSNDLQVLALFLSNYYKPWGTSLDDDSKIQEKITTQLTEGLRNIGFDDTAAKQMIQNVYGASLSTSQQIYVCAEELAVLMNGFGVEKGKEDEQLHSFYTVDLTDWKGHSPYSSADGAEIALTEFMSADGKRIYDHDDTYYLTTVARDFNGDGATNEKDIEYLIEHLMFKDVLTDNLSYRLTLAQHKNTTMDGTGTTNIENITNNNLSPSFNITGMVKGASAQNVSDNDYKSYAEYTGDMIEKSGYFLNKGKLTLKLKTEDGGSIEGTATMKKSKLHYVPLTVYIYNCIISAVADDGMSNLSKHSLDMLRNNIASAYGQKAEKALSEVLRSGGILGYYKDTIGDPSKACIKINKLYESLYASMLSGSDNAETGYLGNCMLAYKLAKKPSGKLTAKVMSTYSTFTQCLYIDWVGNVIADVGDKRVIVYPACVNTCAITTLGGARNLNLVSSWGLRYLNNYNTTSVTSYTHEVDKKNVTCQKRKITAKDITNLQYRACLGENTIATFDSNKGFWFTNIGSGEAGDYVDFLHHLGIIAVDGDNNWTNDGTIGLRVFSKDLCDHTAIAKFLKYKSIENNNVNLDDKSCFASASLITMKDEDIAYFKDNKKFNSGSEDYDYIMDFGTEDKVMLQNIFLTYLYAYNYQDEGGFDSSKHLVDMKFNPSYFPKCGDATSFEIDASVAKEQVQNEITSYMYYFLHPMDGLSFIATWFKNKVSGILIGWHEDIVGSSESNSTTGMTQYLGFTGYVTMPSLYDISWVSWLLTQYNNIVVYLIILIALILVCYIIVGQMTIQRALFGLGMFGILAFIPPIAINSVVDFSNRVCDSIYSSKFDYWALCQLQTYLGKLNTVQNAETVEDYVSALMDIEVSEADTETGYAGVKVKWMTPKKFNELSDAENEMNTSLTKTSSALTNLALNTISKQSSGESFLESDNALYLYRDYCDIYRYASMSRNIYTLAPSLVAVTTDLLAPRVVTEWSSDVARTIKYPSGQYLRSYIVANDENATDYNSLAQYIKDTSSVNAIRKGFLIDTIGVESSTDKHNYWGYSTTAATLGVKYNKAYEKIKTRTNNYEAKTSDKVSITSANLANNTTDTGIYFGLEYSDFALALKDMKDLQITDVATTDKDLSYWYYGLYSESPFYFFSFNVQDQMQALTSYDYNYDSLESSTGNFRKMVLSDNQGYFFNIEDNAGDGYGELRDYMNFHDLFYYIIPALQQGNNLVTAFDKLYGMYAYEDINLKFNQGGSLVYDGLTYSSVADLATSMTVSEDGSECSILDAMSDEMKYKFWHNYNVYTLFNMYTTWLDCMNDCDYAKPTKISVAGEKYTVSNPLDPTSYYEVDDSGNVVKGRYMVFSKSEQKYYGLNDSDLTWVEKKLIDIGNNVYKESIDLMNYYTLSDEVLIQAFSMCQLFEFNKEFSQTSLVSEDFVLYPQGYELKAFTYDAYLRLIISGSTGDALMVDRSKEVKSNNSDASSDDDSSSSSETTESGSTESGSAEVTTETSSLNIKDRFIAGLSNLFGSPINVSCAGTSKNDNLTSSQKSQAETYKNLYLTYMLRIVQQKYVRNGVYEKNYHNSSGAVLQSDWSKFTSAERDVEFAKCIAEFNSNTNNSYNESQNSYWIGVYEIFCAKYGIGKTVGYNPDAGKKVVDDNGKTVTEATTEGSGSSESSDSGSSNSDGSSDSDASLGSEGQAINAGPVELSSLYYRVIHKTSLFFGIVLLINDFIAVYIIPALKLFFLIALFFLSVAMIIAEAFKLEFNFVTVIWKSLFAPLLAFSGVSIGMAWIVSLFMTNGADSVTKSNIVISLGDPTMVLIVMTIINASVVILYWKICKKCFQDLIKYAKAIVNSSVGAVAGTLGKVAGVITAGKAAQNLKTIARNTSDIGGGSGYGAASTPEQRSRDNNPRTGKAGALAVGSLAGVGATKAAEEASNGTKRNKYDEMIDNINKGMANDKAKIDEINGQRKKTRMEKNLEAKASADEKALQGKAAFKNSNLGIRQRVSGGVDAVTGTVSSKFNGTKANIRRKVWGETGQSRLDRLVNGTGENRGLTRQQVMERDEARQHLEKSKQTKAKVISRRDVVNARSNKEKVSATQRQTTPVANIVGNNNTVVVKMGQQRNRKKNRKKKK